MMNIKITVQTPFSFCERCGNQEIEAYVLGYDNQEMQFYRCKMRHYCANAVRLYQEEQAEGKENERRKQSPV